MELNIICLLVQKPLQKLFLIIAEHVEEDTTRLTFFILPMNGIKIIHKTLIMF